MGYTYGLVFHFRSKYYKLVDIEWGLDNSFYFLPQRHESEIRTRLKTEVDESGLIALDLDEIEGNHFPGRKISRHPSGYYHIKDVVGAGGLREKDGLTGPAFKDTGGFYVFLVACPQAIETLVEVDAPGTTDIIAKLPDEIEPFTVQFAVWDKAVNVKIPMTPGKYLGDGVIVVANESLKYGMIIMFVNVTNMTPDLPHPFPARTTYIIR